MLCKRIVFTNDSGKIADEFINYIEKSDIHHKTHNEEDYREVVLKTDDERLYQVCLELSEKIKGIIVRQFIFNYLNRHYDCFNSDEKKVIALSVLKYEFFSELAGRTYIFLKVNKVINPVSFYNFMCRDIRTNTEKALCEEAEKILSVNDGTDFIEILKYFSKISPEEADTVELTADSTGVRISACFPGESISNLEEYGEEESDVLSDLVTLNPKHIEVYGREDFLKCDLAGVITAVFEERIEYKG